MVRSKGESERLDPSERVTKIRCLTKLIAELASNDCPTQYISLLKDKEPLLYLYLIERRGSRTVLRFGANREFILANSDFCHDLPAPEWLSYLRGRKVGCIKILEELLATLLAKENESHLV